MKKIKIRSAFFAMFILLFLSSQAQKEIYEIRVYDLKNDEQVKTTDNYLENALLPALHRQGIMNIGVFKPIANDTSPIRKIYVIIPYKSAEIWEKTKTSISSSPLYLESSKSFSEADTSHLSYVRMECSLLSAFPDQTKLVPTHLKSNPDAVYELRSYESPTEKLHQLKVEMFNAGGEIKLFKKLDFQALFYGDVLTGSRMPNLIYMIAFANLSARDEHWKSFGSSNEWKTLSADPHYQNNISVSHIDSTLMRRTSYSDL
jgi:NIPSNAP